MSEIIDPWPPGISSLINEEDKSELNFFFLGGGANLGSRFLSMKIGVERMGLRSKKKLVTNLGEGIQIGKAVVCSCALHV